VNQVNGIEGALHRIRRINNSTALVVGDDGVILKTTNAGATWSAKTSGTTANLLDVSLQGAYGMAIADAMVLRTTDYGENWAPVTHKQDHFCIDVLSDMDAYLGVGGGIYRTTDGGTTWNVFIGGLLVHALDFIDLDHGAIVTNYTTLAITSDGGANWEYRIVGNWGEVSIAATEMIFTSPTDIVMSTSGTFANINSQSTSELGYGIEYINGDLYGSAKYAARGLNGLAENAGGDRLFAGNGGSIYQWSADDHLPITAGPWHESLDGGALTFASQLGAQVFNFYDYVTPWFSYSSFQLTADGGATWSRTNMFDLLVYDLEFAPTGAPVPALYGVGRDPVNGLGLIVKSTVGGAAWTTGRSCRPRCPRPDGSGARPTGGAADRDPCACRPRPGRRLCWPCAAGRRLVPRSRSRFGSCP
jgi:hypothetical protein